MGNLLQDVKYAARMLAKSPGFTVVAVVTLALGIGANTAIFSVVNAALLRPLPADRPEELVAVFTSDFSGPAYGTSSYPDYLDFREKTDVFSALAAIESRTLSLSTGGPSEHVQAEVVTVNYFDLLGVRPVHGRGFLPSEGRAPGADPVVVLSHGYWQRRFGGDTVVIGRQITLNGHPYTVIGIAPEGFPGMIRPIRSDLWVPVQMRDQLASRNDSLASRGSRNFLIIGRLRAGATLAEARAQFTMLAQQLFKEYPDNWRDVTGAGRRLTLVPESEMRVPPFVRGEVLGFSALLMTVVGLVLVIACVNVANLLLARGTSRRREIAIRLSVGASRGRLLRQLLTESALLGLLAGGAGLVLAMWVTDLLMRFRPPVAVPLELVLRFDARVFAFTLVVSLLTGLLFGLAPALQATRPDVLPALKEESGAQRGPGRNRLRRALIVGQVAVSLLLLVSAGLFLRSLGKAHNADVGFDLREGLLFATDLQPQGYTAERGRVFYTELVEQVRQLPGVESVSLSRWLPLGMEGSRRWIVVEGYTRRPGEDMEFHYNVVGPKYFRTLGVPVVRGREFTAEDRPGAPGVVIVNETMARRFWPGQEPLGKRFSITGDAGPYLEVVGVVRDGKYQSLGEEPRPYFVTPFDQTYRSDMTLVVRVADNETGPAVAIRDVFASLDRSVPVAASTLREHLSVSLFPVRMAGGLLGIFGLLALILVSVGLYGMMSYSVNQRTREIGIRVALGAEQSDVLKLILRQGAALVMLGTAMGLAVAAGVTRVLASLLYGVSPTDAATFAGVALILVAVGLLACWIPARRATKVDPMVALRYE